MGLFRSSNSSSNPRPSKGFSFRIIDTRIDRWLSVDYLKETTGHLKSIFVDTFVPKKARYSETFEEALERLQLSEQELLNRQTEFFRLFCFFIGLSLCVISYGIYLAYTKLFLSALIAFCLSLYALTQAFRFHFWLFQLKHRKLGCTLWEWFNSSIEPTESHHITTRSSHDLDKKQ